MLTILAEEEGLTEEENQSVEKCLEALVGVARSMTITKFIDNILTECLYRSAMIHFYKALGIIYTFDVIFVSSFGFLPTTFN